MYIPFVLMIEGVGNNSSEEGRLSSKMGFGIWMFLVIMALMLLFAVLSNCLVIYCVYRLKKLRTITNVFICNLSISDIILAGFIMPQKLHDIFHGETFYEGVFLCKLVNFCPVFIITSSVYTLVCISFERHRAIIDCRGYQMSFRKLYICICFTWTFAFAISLPTLLEYTVFVVHETAENHTASHLSCASCASRRLSLANAVFVFIVSYTIPVILMLRNYLHVALFVWRKGRQIQHDSEPTGNSLSSFHLFKHRLHLVKLLVMVAVIFAVSWFPYFVMLLYAKATGNDASENAAGFVNLFLIALAIFSTAYNVVLYVVFNPSFKSAIKGILKCSKTTDIFVHRTTNEHTKQSPHPADEWLQSAEEAGRIFTVNSKLSPLETCL